MEKKELKVYETPMAEVVELKYVAPLLAGSDPDDVPDEDDV
jgi:hypothetical protein